MVYTASGTYRKKGLNQSATYWGTPVPDGKGWFTFADPVLIDCRWEDKSELFLNAMQEEKMSVAFVYVGQDMDLNGWMALGDYVDSSYDSPASVSTAFKIERFDKTPNHRGTKYVGKVYL
jgi:hypothetical protein